jgi:hypothetical protein
MSKPFMRKLNPFKPTDIAACSLWLDAADRSTFTLSGLNILQWNDKSGLGRNATAVGTIPLSSSINGISTPGYSLNNNTYFSGTSINTGTTLSAFAVYIQNANSTGNNRIVSLGTIGTLDWNNISSISAILMIGPNFVSYRNSNQLGTIAGTFGVPSLSSSISTGQSNTFYLNGRAGTTVASSGNFNYSTYFIGSTVGEQNFSALSGTVGEVILYNSSLTDPQRQQVEGYLAQKWGLQPNLPAGSPGRTGVIYPRSPLIDSLTTGQPTRKPFIRSRATLNYIGFTITGSTAASATNYQIPITVFRSIGTNTGSSVYLGTEIYSDYSNLYFLASNQVTALPFYIESGTQTTASARIWVSVSSIPANPSTTKVYIYWNTTGTYTTPSNGTTTFPSLFDDFNGTAGSAPNASKWSVQLRGTSTSSSVQLNGSGEVILTPTDNSISSVSLLSLNTMPANGFSIYIRRKYTTGVYTDTSFATTNTLVASDNSLTSDWWHPTLGGGYMLLYQNTGLVIVRRQPTFTGSSQAPTDLIIPPISTLINTYEIVEIQYSTAGVINFIWNGVNKGTITDTTFLSGGKYVLISQGNYSGISNNVETVDYVFVRSYLNPEPSVTAWGSINTP